MKTKKFDSVAFMRKRRDELSKLYFENPEEFDKRMKDADKKLKEVTKRQKTSKTAKA